MMASGTGSTSSKYVARREVPQWIVENCTQCMDCIVACPDTALPNTAQDISTILRTAIRNYVSQDENKDILLEKVPAIDEAVRAEMHVHSKIKGDDYRFNDIVKDKVNELGILDPESSVYEEFFGILDKVPIAYHKTKAIFNAIERKNPGEGGVFSIFVSDLCKGCGACVTACGSHEALKMIPETEKCILIYNQLQGFLISFEIHPRNILDSTMQTIRKRAKWPR